MYGPSSGYAEKRLEAIIEDVSVGTFLFLRAGQTAHFSHVSVPLTGRNIQFELENNIHLLFQQPNLD